MPSLACYQRICRVLTVLMPLLLSACGKQDAGAAGSSPGDASPAAQKQPVEVATIVRRDLVETLSVIGSLAANESATIRPELTGLVRSIHFDEGQRVKQGDLLLKIDDAEFRAQEAQSQARYELAQLNLQRAENLRQTQSNTQADVDRARSEASAAKSDLDLVQVRLARTEIKAPFDGMVGARSISPGDYVNPQSVVTTIDDLSRMKIEFEVPERFLAKIAAGSRFVVNARTSEAGRSDEKVPGEIYFVSSSIDRATRSSQAKGYLDNAPEWLKPGMFANVELVLSVTKGALTAPEGAILMTPSGARLIAVRGDPANPVAEFVAVRLGARAMGYVAVEPIAGRLTDSDRVVASGVGSLILYPGALLEPRPAHSQYKTTDQP
ncbi:MAG: efflux RND transporter periplasmic adaptor subunit [Opitutaceae bacterium]|nr:efflux RND transporter periplasmic adaptor subunit [Opitutaceae bacterium]